MQLNDVVYIEKASVSAMVYYGEHKREFACPCKWRKMHGVIIGFKGNYVHVHEQGNPSNISAFHINDVRLVDSGVET
jgi:hypothetical protein